jgi:hypothetical protein
MRHNPQRAHQSTASRSFILGAGLEEWSWCPSSTCAGERGEKLRAVIVDDGLDLSYASESGRSIDKDLLARAKVPDLGSCNTIYSELLLECSYDRRRKEFRDSSREQRRVPQQVAPDVPARIEKNNVQRNADTVRTDPDICGDGTSKGRARIV